MFFIRRRVFLAVCLRVRKRLLVVASGFFICHPFLGNNRRGFGNFCMVDFVMGHTTGTSKRVFGGGM